MASRILEDEFETGGDYKITAQFTNYRDYKKTCDFINGLNCDYVIGTELAKPKKQQETIKPQGMLYALKDESMLELAKQVVNAVEYSLIIPKGLESLTVNRKQKTKDRIQELIGYLKNYVEWRE